MMLIYGDEKSLTEADRQKCYAESMQVVHSLDEEGKFIAASPLQDTVTATSLRVRNGKRMITDGPFAETHEQLGGFFLVDAKDLDEALAIAARIPMAKLGTIEVRPVVELDGMPRS